MSKYVCGLLNLHTLLHALIFCCYRPSLTPWASQTPLKWVEIFRLSWMNLLLLFFSLFFKWFTVYLKLIEVLEHRFCRCVCYFIWSLSMSSRFFWTLSKYESIKCQVLFRLLFNVNESTYLKMLHKQLQQQLLAFVIHSTW